MQKDRKGEGVGGTEGKGEENWWVELNQKNEFSVSWVNLEGNA